jgi:hypothetical protein
MMRWFVIVMLFVAVGCSGDKDRNKNKDLDRPKSAERG